ncbi:hypothetical protein BDP55DRAFT_696251 [Colletotrichum godetiae]|uniref:Enoyl reductase (ER) domain-containing protein n=1 Tax=Colletotrichum godetiae TaxID=1209918 RepID=A0AAJ0ER55_9PEZI|nr:uncharacterized protein BDP55DRAFT_696251 [Colletotrichum godetiae]KAK1672352.1 hypothetical protein BDP55DRAFT_696251 [Colletotrichum godetiae]
MDAWQYSSIKETLETSLSLNQKATPPDASSPPPLIIGINPVKYKLPEIPPGSDFCGRIRGQIVFGALSIGTKLPQFGSLGQLLTAPSSNDATLPMGVNPDEAAAIGTAGLTAFQSLPKELLKPGSKVFINGGSGGVGSFTIQFAKAAGAYVVASCSTAKVGLCNRLGADEVIDYRRLNVVTELKRKGCVFDIAVDNIGSPKGLYESCSHFLKSEGVFMQVGMSKSMVGMLRRSLLPGFLGGGKRRFQSVRVKPSREDLEQIGKLILDARVRVLIEEKFEWREAPKAYAKLREGRTTGKIIVHVSKA